MDSDYYNKLVVFPLSAQQRRSSGQDERRKLHQKALDAA